MLEARGNLWTMCKGKAVGITTNGFVKRNGFAVMGRGCAQEAKRMWPELPALLGRKLLDFGNVVHVFHLPSFVEEDALQKLFTFPVKHSWWEDADLDLIHQSAVQIQAIANGEEVFLPRPGCGNGRLSWEAVRPVLAEILGDNFTVVTF